MNKIAASVDHRSLILNSFMESQQSNSHDDSIYLPNTRLPNGLLVTCVEYPVCLNRHSDFVFESEVLVSLLHYDQVNQRQ